MNPEPSRWIRQAHQAWYGTNKAMESAEGKNSGELEALVKKRDNHVSRLFYMMLEFFLIFGLPALAAFFAGRALDNALGTGRMWIIICLIAAFILSWVVVVLRVRKITKELKVLDAKIKKIREEESNI